MFVIKRYIVLNLKSVKRTFFKLKKLKKNKYKLGLFKIYKIYTKNYIKQIKRWFKYFNCTKYKFNVLLKKFVFKYKRNEYINNYIVKIKKKEIRKLFKRKKSKIFKIEKKKLIVKKSKHIVRYYKIILYNYLNKMIINKLRKSIRRRRSRRSLKYKYTKNVLSNKDFTKLIKFKYFLRLIKKKKKFNALYGLVVLKKKNLLKEKLIRINYGEQSKKKTLIKTKYFKLYFKRKLKTKYKFIETFKNRKYLINSSFLPIFFLKKKKLSKFIKKIKYIYTNNYNYKYFKNISKGIKLLHIDKKARKFYKYSYLKFNITLNVKRRKYRKRKSKFFNWRRFKELGIFKKFSFKFILKLKKSYYFKNKFLLRKNIDSVNLINSSNKFSKKKIILIKKASVLKFFYTRKRKFCNQQIWDFSRVSRKVYKYNKLKKILKKKSHSYYININYSKNYYKKKKKNDIIFNCMYLNKHIASHYFIKFLKKNKHIRKRRKSFLYKKIFKYSTTRRKKYKSKRHSTYVKMNPLKFKYKKKQKKKKTYFFNSWRGLLVTWKKSRLFHWKLYREGTLKKRRYRGFLPAFFKKNKIKLDIIIKYFTFKFQFSSLFWKYFTQMYLFFFNKSLVSKQILQIPINFLFWIFLSKMRREKYKLKRRVKSWLYKNIRIKKTFWMEIKKKTPKFFSKQIFSFKKIKNAIQYDFITNYFCIIKNTETYEKVNEYLFNNKMLKMNNFRYKS